MEVVFIVDRRRKQRYESRLNMAGRLNGTRTGEGEGKQERRYEGEALQAKRPRDQCSLVTGQKNSG